MLDKLMNLINSYAGDDGTVNVSQLEKGMNVLESLEMNDYRSQEPTPEIVSAPPAPEPEPEPEPTDVSPEPVEAGVPAGQTNGPLVVTEDRILNMTYKEINQNYDSIYKYLLDHAH